MKKTTLTVVGTKGLSLSFNSMEKMITIYHLFCQKTMRRSAMDGKSQPQLLHVK